MNIKKLVAFGLTLGLATALYGARDMNSKTVTIQINNQDGKQIDEIKLSIAKSATVEELKNAIVEKIQSDLNRTVIELSDLNTRTNLLLSSLKNRRIAEVVPYPHPVLAVKVEAEDQFNDQ